MLRAMEEDSFWLNDLIGMESMVEEFEAPEAVSKAIRRVMERYESEVFSDELSQCDSTDEFDALAGSLGDLNAIAKVDVRDMLYYTEEAREEFEKGRAMMEDRMVDEWKDRRYEERARARQRERSDGAIKDMFGSLH